jgi:hypothetical protein
MDQTDKRKVAAAIGGVMEYLAQEEAAALAAPSAQAAGLQGLWALSGRRHAMRLRCLMQLRAFCGAGPRLG